MAAASPGVSERAAALAAPVKPNEAPALPDAAAPAAPAQTKPVGPTAPGAAQPEAILPAAAKKVSKPIQKTAPSRRLEPGDLICGQCGEGNPPSRKFCSRCGNSLESAEAVKVAWWRKLLPKRKVKTLEAGERPGRGGVKARKQSSLKRLAPQIRKWVGIVGVVFAMLVALVAPFRDWFNRTVYNPARDKWKDFTTQQFDPVRPVSFTSTGQTKANPVDGVFDLAGNTFMVSPAPAKGKELVVTVKFAAPVKIDRAIVQNGARDKYTTYSRPQNVHLVYDTGQTYDLVLKDQPDPQKVGIKNAKGVSSIEIHVVSTYAAVNNPEIALTEMEFFTEK